MMTHFDPLKLSDGQNFECLKIQDGSRAIFKNGKIAICRQP